MVAVEPLLFVRITVPGGERAPRVMKFTVVPPPNTAWVMTISLEISAGLFPAPNPGKE